MNLGRAIDTADMYRKMGVKIGVNAKIQNEVMIDYSHYWHIEIGDNVTIAPRVHILAHDASTEKVVGLTKVANTSIGNNVFIGASSIILPGANIGDNVIVGAGSLVNKPLKSNGVYAGNPAKFITTIDAYKEKITNELNETDSFSEKYTLGRNISEENKILLYDKAKLNGKIYVK